MVGCIITTESLAVRAQFSYENLTDMTNTTYKCVFNFEVVLRKIQQNSKNSSLILTIELFCTFCTHFQGIRNILWPVSALELHVLCHRYYLCIDNGLYTAFFA